jgi:hypothetical protein
LILRNIFAFPDGGRDAATLRDCFFAAQQDIIALQYCVGYAARAGGRGGTECVLKKLKAMRVLKYSLIAGATLLWFLGLSDQLPDLMPTAKYVGNTMLMAAVAAI